MMEIRKYTLHQLSDMAQCNPNHLKEIILSHGIVVPLNGRSNMELIDAVYGLQDGNLPDWVGADNGSQVGPVRNLFEMIDAGNYDGASEHITERNFQIDSFRFTTVGHKVFHFGQDMTTAEILIVIRKEGYGPAGLEPLLAYGKENPDEQRKHLIFAFGAFWVSQAGDRYVPCLAGASDKRGLYLYGVNPGDRWYASSRFLAVRKSS